MAHTSCFGSFLNSLTTLRIPCKSNTSSETYPGSVFKIMTRDQRIMTTRKVCRRPSKTARNPLSYTTVKFIFCGVEIFLTW